MCDNKVAEKALKDYRLYVGRLQEIPEEVKYSFYSSRRGYLFLYTDVKMPDSFVEIDPSHCVELSTEERKWLNDVVGAIVLAWASNNTLSEEELLNSYFDDVERRLEAVREELMKGNENERDGADNGKGNSERA